MNRKCIYFWWAELHRRPGHRGREQPAGFVDGCRTWSIQAEKPGLTGNGLFTPIYPPITLQPAQDPDTALASGSNPSRLERASGPCIERRSSVPTRRLAAASPARASRSVHPRPSAQQERGTLRLPRMKMKTPSVRASPAKTENGDVHGVARHFHSLSARHLRFFHFHFRCAAYGRAACGPDFRRVPPCLDADADPR